MYFFKEVAVIVSRSCTWKRRMIRCVTTRIRMRELPHVFAGQGTVLSAHIARLSVLYEDLRIEVLATAEQSIACLDVTDETYRRHYFIRRSIATVVEFAEALRLLNGSNEFACKVKPHFIPSMIECWDSAVRFFRDQEPFLKLVRNDIGGHFGLQSAEYAIAKADPLTPLKMEVNEKGNMFLHFAGEIAAAATMRHLEGPTVEEGFAKLMKIVTTAFGHATSSVHCIGVAYLWPRFG